ncbi:hypothetical protein [Desulfovermiculus halophilus]|nr:hypothetical protein [Desulfovermiculus halophilus]
MPQDMQPQSKANARVLIQDAEYDASLPRVIDRILEAFPRN